MFETIGRYRITSKLGEGGMGVVYAAEDEQLQRPVAVKTLRNGASDERMRERFWREARSAAAVNHPNICQLYEVGEHNGELFIAMELLEGESLASRVVRGPIPLKEAARIALSILSALDALHRRGLVHRDLKPSNVFLTPHGVKLLDFGLARSFDAADDRTQLGLTMPGTIIGTPQYMAPEQLLGTQGIDRTVDLYATGAILYEMLTSQAVFTGATVVQVAHVVIHDQPPVLGGSPAIAALDGVIHRALSKRPGDRYQNAVAMADDLRATLLLADTGEIPRARPMTRLMVLPFRMLRADPETEFLSFSLPDAITSSLSGLESLVVRSSVTASKFAGENLPDLDELASKADVDIILTGTLLRAGEQVRVNTQLVEVPAGTILWTQVSQVMLGDIFQLQDDLARRIVDSLSLPLTARDHRLLKRDVPSSAKAYEFYLRANPLSYDPKQWTVARDLYRQCVDEDPRYAPAWARLGRIYRVIGKMTGEDPAGNMARSEAAFKRALEINPDLPIAHSLYTDLEVELGRGESAMLRLLERIKTRSAEPETFSGLVQACRYSGLLEASVAAYAHAHRLDPAIRTSVAHSYWMLGQYERAMETDCEQPPWMKLFSLAAIGREDEAISELKKIEESSIPRTPRQWAVAQRASLEGDHATCAKVVRGIIDGWQNPDPCALFYLGEMVARVGETALALRILHDTIEGGFFCFTFMLRDPALDSLRSESEFTKILRRAETRYRHALSAFHDADGDRLLGISTG